MKDEIQTFCKGIGDGGCLCFCYLFSTLKETKMTPYEANAFLLAGTLAAVEKGLVESNGYVNNAVDLLEYVDPAHKYDVEKRKINSVTDLGDKETAAVLFTYNGKGHWVLVSDRQIVFDSLTESKCRKYGKITDARVITRKDK